jgi:hypothetical protein
MEQHKIELLPNGKPIKTKQRRWNPKYTTMVKEASSLDLWKQLDGFLNGISVKEKRLIKGMC